MKLFGLIDKGERIMKLYGKLLDEIFCNLSNEQHDRLAMCLLTNTPPKRGEEEWLRGVYFVCQKAKVVLRDKED